MAVSLLIDVASDELGVSNDALSNMFHITCLILWGSNEGTLGLGTTSDMTSIFSNPGVVHQAIICLLVDA